MLIDRYSYQVNKIIKLTNEQQDELYFNNIERCLMQTIHLQKHLDLGSDYDSVDALTDSLVLQNQILEDVDSLDKSCQEFLLPKAKLFLISIIQEFRFAQKSKKSKMEITEKRRYVVFAINTIRVLRSKSIEDLKLIIRQNPVILEAIKESILGYHNFNTNENALGNILERINENSTF
jgi:hypothetical protein